MEYWAILEKGGRAEMTKQTDYIVNDISDMVDNTIYHYVHTPEFDTKQEAEKLKQQIIENQKIVSVLKTAGLSYLKGILPLVDYKRFEILFDEKSMKILEFLVNDEKSADKDRWENI